MDKLKIEDTVFSQAFVKQLSGLKDIFGIKGTNFRPLRGDIKEIQLDRLSVDFIYEVDNEKLIHFEFQSTKKNDDIYRFQLYDAHLISQYKKPIETYVIYTNDILKVNNELDYGSVKYKFNPIYMGNFSADKILNVTFSSEKSTSVCIANTWRLRWAPCSQVKRWRWLSFLQVPVGCLFFMMTCQAATSGSLEEQ